MNRRSLLQLALTPFLAPFIARRPLTSKGVELFPEPAHSGYRYTIYRYCDRYAGQRLGVISNRPSA